MKISLTDAGKRYNREWIFRHFTHNFESGRSYAITGPNGSGKSTLLQALSGSMYINEGKCIWQLNGNDLPVETVYRQISICAPYLELIEEMTLKEFLEFHSNFKRFLPGTDTSSIISVLELGHAANKQIRYFSSGMRQRVKLAQCIFSDVSVILLDEPCTNFDEAGIQLYHKMISQYCKERLVVVSSNDPIEYEFCEENIRLTDFKNLAKAIS
jgi:ABC-type multidrug transport system ATPase subunit